MMRSPHRRTKPLPTAAPALRNPATGDRGQDHHLRPSARPALPRFFNVPCPSLRPPLCLLRLSLLRPRLRDGGRDFSLTISPRPGLWEERQELSLIPLGLTIASAARRRRPTTTAGDATSPNQPHGSPTAKPCPLHARLGATPTHSRSWRLQPTSYPRHNLSSWSRVRITSCRFFTKRDSQ